MNNTALNQARRICEWAGLSPNNPTRRAVYQAWLLGDTRGGLSALKAGQESLGALGYMVDELLERVRVSQYDARIAA